MQNLCRQVTDGLVPSVPIKPISHYYKFRSVYGRSSSAPGSVASAAIAKLTTLLTSTQSIPSSFLVGTEALTKPINESVPYIQVPRQICLTELEIAC